MRNIARPRPRRAEQQALARSAHADWVVADREALAGLLVELYGPGPGWRSRAAKALDLRREQVTRLLDGTRKALRPRTFARLMTKLPQSRRARLARVFLAPEERDRHRAYDEWLGYPSEPIPTSASGTAWGATLSVRHRGDEAMPPRPEDVRMAIRGLRSYVGEFNAFRAVLRKRWGPTGDVENRADVAELWAIAPLAAAGHTGGVERSAWELHEAGELGPYLRAALRAQLIVLHRPPASARVRTASRGPTRGNPLGR